MNLSDILDLQVQQLQMFHYENELHTMQTVFSMPSATLKLSSDWLKNLKTEITPSDSKKLRIKGNEALKCQQLLTAADYYTQAIIAAEDKSEELALAHANRAQVLLEFGYYTQAYDDCVCALKNGYPQKLKHKVLLRQATCAAKQNNVQLLKLHIEELKDIALNTQSESKLLQLQAQFEMLFLNDAQESTEKSDTENKVQIRQSVGRCLQACKPIAEDEIIFQETAYSCVPAGPNNKKCVQCLTTLYIPFPCGVCKIHYCSLACFEKDACVHKYECAAYRLDFFRHIGIGHLALRTVLKGVPELLNLLKSQTNAEEVWQSIFKLNSTQTSYMETINLQIQFTTADLENIKYYALVSYTLSHYLLEFTDFFHTLGRDWHLIVSALILRHIGQFIINAHEVITLQPINECCLLDHEIWSAVHHLKPGYLHRLNAFGVIAAANFPLLSMANHACKPSFQTVFHGATVSTLARKNIQEGEEIFNCYTLNYKISTKLQRAAALEEHNFVCTCEICTLSNPDYYYERFYTFKCEFCNAQFIPQTNQLASIFNPRQDCERIDCKVILLQPLKCTACGHIQNLTWYKRFLILIVNIMNMNMRGRELWRKLFKKYFGLNKFLPKHNELHVTLGSIVMEQMFKVIKLGYHLDEVESSLAGSAIEFYLDKVALKYGHFSLEYASQMTFLWDFLALYKYKCHPEFRSRTLSACGLLSNEFQKIFKNYFHDYINQNDCFI